jgi:hypothetical protein
MIAMEMKIDDIIKKIRDWLTVESTFKCQIPDDNARSHFQIDFPPGSGGLIDIIFPKPKKTFFLLSLVLH